MTDTVDLQSLSSEALVERYLRRGDVEAIGRLFDREAPGLYRLALALLGDPTSAEDALQDTFLTALEGLDRFDASRRIGPWLVGILRNIAHRARRDRARRPDPERVAATRIGAGPALDDDERARVREALDRLEEPYRSAALLHYVHGLAPAEIAHLRAEPPGTTRSLLARARKRLEGRLRALSAVFLAARGPRGLAAVRAAVVTRAGALAASSSVGAGVLGGWIVTKKLVLAALALGACLVGIALTSGWIPLGSGGSQAGVDPAMRGAEGDVASGGYPVLRGRAGKVDEDRGAVAGTRTDASHVAGVVRDGAGQPVAGARVLAVVDVDRPRSAEDVAGGEPGTLVTSDGQGRFGIQLGTPRRNHVLLVEAPGYAPRASASVRAGDDVEVVLAPGGRLSGRVLDREGNPIVGATVSLEGMYASATFLRRATSDGAGRYEVADLPMNGEAPEGEPGLVAAILVEAEGFAPLFLSSTADWLRETDASGTDHDLTLVRGASITGHVVDAETSEPIASARVVLISPEGMISWGWAPGRRTNHPWGGRVLGTTEADGNGTFRFDHVPAPDPHAAHFAPDSGGSSAAFVTALAPGYAANEVTASSLADGGSSTIEISLWPATEVRGRVVDPKGRPQVGVTVSVSVEGSIARSSLWWRPGREDLPKSWGETGSEGRFALLGVPAPRGHDAQATLRLAVARVLGAAASSQRTLSVRGGRSVDVGDVTLASDADTRVVRIRVVDEQGVPVPDVAFGYGFPRMTRTDEEGVGLVGLSPRTGSGPVRMMAMAPRYASTPFTLDPAGPDDVEVRLGPPHQISGRVVHVDGSPWPNVPVLAAVADAPVEQAFPEQAGPVTEDLWTARRISAATSSDDGSFTLGSLPAGRFHLEARVQHGSPGAIQISRALSADVPAGTTGVDLVLPSYEEATGRLEVEVVEAETQAPVAGATVRLRSASRSYEAAASAPGRYRVTGAAAGTYDLRVDRRGLVPSILPIVSVVEGAESPPVRVALQRGTRVRGRVLADPACGDLQGWYVSVDPLAGGESYDAVTSGPINAEMEYQIQGLRSGSWFVTLIHSSTSSGPTPAPARMQPIVVPEGAREMTFDLPLVPGGDLRVHVMDARLPTLPPVGGWPTGSAGAQARETYGGRCVLSLETLEGRRVAATRTVLRGFAGPLSHLSLPPGTYVLRLELPEAPALEERVEVKAGETTDVSIGRR